MTRGHLKVNFIYSGGWGWVEPWAKMNVPDRNIQNESGDHGSRFWRGSSFPCILNGWEHMEDVGRQPGPNKKKDFGSVTWFPLGKDVMSFALNGSWYFWGCIKYCSRGKRIRYYPNGTKEISKGRHGLKVVMTVVLCMLSDDKYWLLPTIYGTSIMVHLP